MTPLGLRSLLVLAAESKSISSPSYSLAPSGGSCHRLNIHGDESESEEAHSGFQQQQ